MVTSPSSSAVSCRSFKAQSSARQQRGWSLSSSTSSSTKSKSMRSGTVLLSSRRRSSSTTTVVARAAGGDDGKAEEEKDDEAFDNGGGCVQVQLTHSLKAPGFSTLEPTTCYPGIKSEKQCADAILDTSLTSQAHISQLFAFRFNLRRYTTAAGSLPRTTGSATGRAATSRAPKGGSSATPRKRAPGPSPRRSRR
jgi:hypothetical protein